jgi:peptidoglycan hydrolase-like protein with peptidoglycan-binding domain
MASRLTRADFVQSLQDKKVDVDAAEADPALAGVDVGRADLNADGKVAGSAEAAALFREVDRFDRNGDAGSIDLTDAAGAATRAAAIATALKARAVFETSSGRALTDAALKTALTGATLPLGRGSKSDAALAVQYTLARLGFSLGLVDGDFGPASERAVKAFQAVAALPQTGAVDEATLRALDTAVSTADLRTPAEKSGNALAYLSNHTALGLAKFQPLTGGGPAGWAHPGVQERYGAFVGAYWEHLKTNRVEADCKTLSMFFMDQFRAKLKADLGVDLPRPSGLPTSAWVAATRTDPKGFFTRFENLARVRPGYQTAQRLGRLDPKASLLVGVNLRHASVDAHMAARAVKLTLPWAASRDNRGDAKAPELPVAQLKAGDLIIIDHTGDGRFDHMANVVRVDKDAAGKVKSLVIATGSYDDMKDADGSTTPNGLGEVNNYAEEVTIDFDAAGKVARSKVTWSSEPAWLQPGRYAARTLLMELKAGGVIAAGRWG